MIRVDLTSAITAVFIGGMVWLRTRMQYVQRGRSLQLEWAGKVYFACAAALLALGWLIAPAAGAAFWPAGASNPALTRVIWFLGSYYVFIVVHRYLKARGIAVFRVRDEQANPPAGPFQQD